MPGDDLLLDDSGDYTLTDGAFETTTTAGPALRHQVLDELGAWVGDPEAGRDKVEENAPKDSPEARDLVADSLRVSLRALEREGRLPNRRSSSKIALWREGVLTPPGRSGATTAPK